MVVASRVVGKLRTQVELATHRHAWGRVRHIGPDVAPFAANAPLKFVQYKKKIGVVCYTK